jgi:pyruvate dehydrogenase E1 component alpha subunit
MTGGSIADRASGFGLPSVQVDGQDVCAVYRATREARDRAASGEGPTFIEAITYRYNGHNTGEIAAYRTQDEIEEWRRTRDPIEGLRRALESGGRLSGTGFAELADRARQTVADAIAFSESSPLPDPQTATAGVVGIPFDPRGPA